MVNIPQGNFYLGDGVSTGTIRQSGSTNPFPVISEDAITAGGSGIAGNSSYHGVEIATADYPSFAEVYCMKYISGRYIDFLNMLTQDQKNNRFITPGTTTNNYRYNPTGAWPNIQPNLPFIAMNYMTWTDLLALFRLVLFATYD